MLLKKTHVPSASQTRVIPIRSSVTRLESLYAQRSAVEVLIQSLEDYARFRAKRLQTQECRTA